MSKSYKHILRNNSVIRAVNSYFTPAFLFSENNMKKAVSKFTNAKPIRLYIHSPPKKAAILIPVCEVNGEICLLYIQKTGAEHKGQVTFPGGLQRMDDKKLEKTAIRETEQKLGIHADDIEVWCQGNYIITKSDAALLPVLGRIKGSLVLNKLPVNKNFVKEVFTVPLEDLCDPAKLGYTQFRDTYSFPTFLSGKRRIWGLTGIITNLALSSLLPSSVYNHRVKSLPVVRNPNKTLGKY